MPRSTTIASSIRLGNLTRRQALTASAVVGFAVLTALATYVRIPLPFSPVPVTAQTIVVLLSGAFLGPLAGSLSQVLFIGLGATGLAIFAGGSFSGLTGGYLIGFVLATALIGTVARRTDSVLAVGGAMLAGNVLLLLTGAAWLSLVLNLSVMEALTLGVLPFLPGDVIKLAAAVMVWRAGAGLWRRALREPAS